MEGQYTKTQVVEAVKAAHAAGDIAAANELAAYADTLPEDVEVTPLADKLEATFQENATEFLDRIDVLNEDEYNTASAYVGAGISQLVSAGGDVAMDLVTSGLSHLPESFKAPPRKALAYLANSDAGKAGIAAAIKGAEAYDEWKTENPQEAERLRQVVDVGAILFPRGNPVRPRAVVNFRKKSMDIRQREIGDSMRPPVTQNLNQWDESSMLSGGREAIYKPNAQEMEMYRVIDETVSEYNPGRTARYNNARVLEKVEDLKTKLDDDIVTAGNPAADVAQLKQDLSDSLANILEHEGMGLTSDAETVAKRVLDEAYKLIDASDGTALGLLNARRDLDKVVARVRGLSAYDPARDSGISVAVQRARTLINGEVDRVAHSANVSDSLYRQSTLLKATDRLQENARSEGTNALRRVVARIQDLPFVGTTVAGMAATAGVVGAATGNAGLIGLGLTAAGIVIAGKTVPYATKAGRKIITEILDGSRKAINAAQKSEVAKLKADRAILVEYLREQMRAGAELGYEGAEIPERDTRATNMPDIPKGTFQNVN